MKTSMLFPAAFLVALSGCAPYQLVPEDPVVRVPPPVHHEIEVVAEAESPEAPEVPEVKEPTFKDLSPTAWTVQIAAVRHLEEMAAVESNNRLEDVLHIPTRNQQLGDLHTVLVGVYDSLEEAKSVAMKLPARVAGDDPWIRSVASVQAVMRE